MLKSQEADKAPRQGVRCNACANVLIAVAGIYMIAPQMHAAAPLQLMCVRYSGAGLRVRQLSMVWALTAW